MTIYQSLQKFYIENNFPIDGGESDAYFDLKFQFFTLKLPNFKFRKEVIYIHDIQHILYNCDTSWKGEAFIAGLEIGTKMWKHIPIGFISLWAMGFSLLNHPKQVLKGYKTGINIKNILDLQLKKDTLLQLSISDLKAALQKEHATPINWLVFLFWCFIGEIVFLLPLLLIIICIILL